MHDGKRDREQAPIEPSRRRARVDVLGQLDLPAELAVLDLELHDALAAPRAASATGHDELPIRHGDLDITRIDPWKLHDNDEGRWIRAPVDVDGGAEAATVAHRSWEPQEFAEGIVHARLGSVRVAASRHSFIVSW